MKNNNRCRACLPTDRLCKKSKCKEGGDFCSSHKLQCGICLENINNCYTLGCSHSFCSECISKWICFGKNKSCPMCRKEVTFYENDFAINYCENHGLLKKIINWNIKLYAYPHAESLLMEYGIHLKKNYNYTKQDIININNGIKNNLVKRYFINLVYSSSKKIVYTKPDDPHDELYTFT
jgi:hypothetical protein